MSVLEFNRGTRRLPMVLQTEAAECGLACIAMVMTHHGHETDIATLRTQLTVSLKGMSLAQLIEAAQRFGLASRPLRLEMEELAELQTPCILHWGLNHFVVLRTVNRKTVEIHDPAVGIRKLPHSEVSQYFTGVALELTPTSSFVHQEEKPRLSVMALFGRLIGAKRQLVQVLMLSVGVELLLLLSPLYVQWVVDNAIVVGDRDLVHLLAIAFGLLAVVQVVIGTLRSWLVLNLGTSISVQWSINVFSHLLRLPQGYFEKRHLGDVVSRFDAIGSIQNTLTRTFIEATVDALMAIVTLAMMLIYSGLLTVVTLIATALYALLRWIAYAPLREATQDLIVLKAKQESTFLESVRAIQAIKLFHRESQRQVMWHNRTVETTNRMLRTERLMIGYKLGHGVLSGIEHIVVIWIGAQLILNNMFSIGMLFAFVTYRAIFSARMSQLIDNTIQLKMVRLHAERLADIVLTPKEASEQANVRFTALDHDVQIRNLSFRYSDLDPYVIRNLNLDIKSGQSVALVGPSGSGKTTLAKLILGLLVPTNGCIKVGGHDLSKLDLSSYREHVNAVMQDDQLLAGSIAENISFFDDQPDASRIQAAAELAAIHDDIENMPMGYHTLVGDMGTSLSGGQKQRVLLARALYRQPSIIVLDEATSHMDVALERAVNQAIRKLPITRIVIAHRPETIASCDQAVDLAAINNAKEPKL